MARSVSRNCHGIRQYIEACEILPSILNVNGPDFQPRTCVDIPSGSKGQAVRMLGKGTGWHVAACTVHRTYTVRSYISLTRIGDTPQ